MRSDLLDDESLLDLVSYKDDGTHLNGSVTIISDLELDSFPALVQDDGILLGNDCTRHFSLLVLCYIEDREQVLRWNWQERSIESSLQVPRFCAYGVVNSNQEYTIEHRVSTTDEDDQTSRTRQ